MSRGGVIAGPSANAGRRSGAHLSAQPGDALSYRVSMTTNLVQLYGVRF